jgi:glycosyltransferase involved in cell wall biosynthesis
VEPLAVQVVSRLSVGGSVTQAILTATAVREHGFRSIVVHGVPPAHEGSLAGLADRLDVERVVLEPLRRDPALGDVHAVREMRRLLRDLQPDIVHTHAAKAGAIGRMAAGGVPVVVHTFHGHVLRGYFDRRREHVFRRIERRLARRTDCVVAVSDEVRHDLIELGIAAPAKIRTIPVGLDLAAYDLPPAAAARIRAEVRAELGIAETDPVVAFAGRLERVKRPDRFVDVACRVTAPGARFLVVGDGSERGAVEANHELGGRLILAGFRNDIARVLQAVDVVVLTSDAEGTPVSLIEAAACGLPVVTTDVGGVGSVVADGRTGFVLPREDVGAMAAAVDRLLTDPDARAAMGAAGRAHVIPRFGLHALGRRHADLYRALLAPTLRR